MKNMTDCKRYLASLWFLGAGLLFFIILAQSILGRYGDRSSEAWSWFLPTIMPTLSVIIGVLVMDAIGKGVNIDEINGFLFKLTFGISCCYLFAVLLVILLQPFSSLSPFAVMSQSSLWLGPFQGLVAAAMSAFFVQSATPTKNSKRKASSM
jgi:hypothetical protein